MVCSKCPGGDLAVQPLAHPNWMLLLQVQQLRKRNDAN